MTKMLRMWIALTILSLGTSPALAKAARGGRIEVLAGWDRNRYGDGSKTNALTVGIGAGYDLPIIGNFAVGADVEASISTSSLKVDFPDGHTIKLDEDSDLYAGARLSFNPSDPLTLFVRGGFATARKSYSFSGPVYNERTNYSRDGFRVGGGIQRRLGKNFYLGGEYRYSEYLSFQARHQVVASVGYRF